MIFRPLNKSWPRHQTDSKKSWPRSKFDWKKKVMTRYPDKNCSLPKLLNPGQELTVPPLLQVFQIIYVSFFCEIKIFASPSTTKNTWIKKVLKIDGEEKLKKPAMCHWPSYVKKLSS